MKWVFLSLVAILWVTGGTLLVRYRHAEELRDAARLSAHWDSRKGSQQDPSPEVLAALPELPRAMIRSVCVESGGDTLGRHNCYDDASEWLNSTAQEHEERSLLGYASLGAGGMLSLFGVWQRRRRQRQRALFSEVPPNETS